jgi:multiple sugar transport system permease protein
MKSLDAWISLAVAGACYLTAWFWLVMATTAIRRRQWPALALLVVGAFGSLALAFRGPFAFPLRPLIYLPLAAGAAGIAFALLLPSEKWDGLKRRREDARQAALHLVLVTGCALFALPYLWMVLTSLKPDDSIFRNPTALPEVWMWSNYPRAFNFLEVSLGRISTGFGSLFLLNTLQVTALSMAGMILSCSLVAYSFARLRWPGRDVLFMVLLGTMMLPDAVTMIPRFLIFKELGWVDTLLPLWVPSLFAGSAFSVFLLRQFLLTIPSELEDAAKIDGCGYFTIYWRIMMPLIKPALASLAIMHFLATWNDFMGPLIYISSPEKMTGSYALRLFQSAGSGEWALLLAASTMWTIPVVLLFFFAQRAFIEGIAMTGMKN